MADRWDRGRMWINAFLALLIVAFATFAIVALAWLTRLSLTELRVMARDHESAMHSMIQEFLERDIEPIVQPETKAERQDALQDVIQRVLSGGPLLEDDGWQQAVAPPTRESRPDMFTDPYEEALGGKAESHFGTYEPRFPREYGWAEPDPNERVG